MSPTSRGRNVRSEGALQRSNYSLPSSGGVPTHVTLNETDRDGLPALSFEPGCRTPPELVAVLDMAASAISPRGRLGTRSRA